MSEGDRRSDRLRRVAWLGAAPAPRPDSGYHQIVSIGTGRRGSRHAPGRRCRFPLSRYPSARPARRARSLVEESCSSASPRASRCRRRSSATPRETLPVSATCTSREPRQRRASSSARNSSLLPHRHPPESTLASFPWPSSSHRTCARSSGRPALRRRLVQGRAPRPCRARRPERRRQDDAAADPRRRDREARRRARIPEGHAGRAARPAAAARASARR